MRRFFRVALLGILGSPCGDALLRRPVSFTDNFNDGDTRGGWGTPSPRLRSAETGALRTGLSCRTPPVTPSSRSCRTSACRVRHYTLMCCRIRWPGMAARAFGTRASRTTVSVLLYPGPGVCIGETVAGVSSLTCLPCLLTRATVHHLAVEPEAANWQVRISVDGSFLVDYQANRPDRAGASGCMWATQGRRSTTSACWETTSRPFPNPPACSASHQVFWPLAALRGGQGVIAGGAAGSDDGTFGRVSADGDIGEVRRCSNGHGSGLSQEND